MYEAHREELAGKCFPEDLVPSIAMHYTPPSKRSKCCSRQLQLGRFILVSDPTPITLHRQPSPISIASSPLGRTTTAPLLPARTKRRRMTFSPGSARAPIQVVGSV
ncbi:hypothetical protein DPSP01_005547 [Paraphaeosphaeria sporulosa]